MCELFKNSLAEVIDCVRADLEVGAAGAPEENALRALIGSCCRHFARYACAIYIYTTHTTMDTIKVTINRELIKLGN